MRRCVVDNEKSDNDILDGEEEVLAIGGKRILVSKGVHKSYGVGQSLQNIGWQGETAS